MKRITLLGSSSGRNAGDAALLASIMRDIHTLDSTIKFEIPTINPSFIKNNYPSSLATPISMLPWNLSIKMLGLPTFLSVRRTDLTMVFDAILFDRSLYNPLFNYLSTLAFLIPYAKKIGKPVIYYNVSVGPMTTKRGIDLLRFISNQVDLICVRDEDSLSLLESIGVTIPKIVLTADSALNNQPCSPERAVEIMKAEGIRQDRRRMGFNINSYIDTWVETGKKHLSSSEFQTIVAQTVDRLIEDLQVDVVFVVTQHMDIDIVHQTMERIRNKECVSLISNIQYTHPEIMGILKEVDLFIGMRMHSLVLATAMITPAIGIVYQNKVRSFMKQIGQGERVIEFSDFNVAALYSLARATWLQRDEIKRQLETRIKELQKQARESAKYVVDFLK